MAHDLTMTPKSANGLLKNGANIVGKVAVLRQLALGGLETVKTVRSKEATKAQKWAATAKFTVDSGVAIGCLRLGAPGAFFAGVYFLADATGLIGGINRAMAKEIRRILEKQQK